MKVFFIAAVLASVASASCIDDLLGVGKDAANAGLAMKDIATECAGSDHPSCSQAVDKLLSSISTAVADVSKCTTSCENQGPDCVAEINKLSDAIKAIDAPAHKMADECQGAHKSTMDCVFDGIKVGDDVVNVAKEVGAVVSKCKSGTEIVV